mmetsp:Transcript_62824/g.130618  ORF Transcript_62824/g.130618 Transcript_62824/m.130618 type:complete len:243 (+) Transcript_62824:476-1204(+)
MEAVATTQRHRALRRDGRANVLALNTAVHERPVVVQRVATNQTDCRVVLPLWAVLLLLRPVAHARGHPVCAHLRAVSAEDAEVEPEEKQHHPDVGQRFLQAKDASQLKEIRHNAGIPNHSCTVAELECIEEEGVDKAGRPVWDRLASRLVHDVEGTCSPQNPAEEQLPKVKFGRKKEWYQPQTHQSNLLIRSVIFLLPVHEGALGQNHQKEKCREDQSCSAFFLLAQMFGVVMQLCVHEPLI